MRSPAVVLCAIAAAAVAVFLAFGGQWLAAAWP